ncbi:hypothetical protein MN116_001853 [Schistosoma mekongi]|uniref:Methyltransferase-like protein 9 n=1 Tax=Schistosoma mekongi TaxID=38744 RepID=A0AAE2D7U6_SCHME|nr:hypothetical protein MN116_001853 [Schistosoma mekongi]
MGEYIRSPLIRLMYEKLEHQNKHLHSNHDNWYDYRPEYVDFEFRDIFIQSYQDEETCKFLDNCYMKSDWLFTHFYHAIVKAALTWFMTSTSINGLVGRGSMFVFSSAQFLHLLNVNEDFKSDFLLDLGAGDGNVTLKMSPYFKMVYVTEISPVMRWRLSKHGFSILDVDSWKLISKQLDTPEVPSHFDVISCLNLLDRCTAPITLLKRINQALKPITGILILGIVLPLKQYVETTHDQRPNEILDIVDSELWEVQLSSLIKNILIPANFNILRWTRLPYLCEGDFLKSFYYLNEIILVLQTTI